MGSFGGEKSGEELPVSAICGAPKAFTLAGATSLGGLGRN